MEHKLIRSPSPDFSTLTYDELEQLEQVLRKQTEIEYEQNQSLSGLRRTMIHLQQTINDDNQQRTISESTPTNSTMMSTTNLCYICSTTCNQINSFSSLSFLENREQLHYCHDCQRLVCRRCGNYTNTDLILQSNDENRSTSKWCCRICLVKREVVKKSGTWNIGEENFVHSPIKLLHKLVTFRTTSQSTNTSPTLSSPTSTIRSSPSTERKLSILEPSNFFSRLWRDASRLAITNHTPTMQHLPLSSTHENESSFDHLSDVYTVPSSDQNISPLANMSPPAKISSPKTRRMSFMREITRTADDLMSGNNTTSQTKKKLTQHASNIITVPSFKDYLQPHQPDDSLSEIKLESFEPNASGVLCMMQLTDKKHVSCVNYDERPRTLSTNIYSDEQFNNTKTTTTVLTMPSSSDNTYDHKESARYIVEHIDSLSHPEASIDLSTGIDYCSSSMIMCDENENEDDHLQQKASRSVHRNSESWTRKRALMKRNYEWTTTVEGKDESNSTNQHCTSTPHSPPIASTSLKRTACSLPCETESPPNSLRSKHEEKRRSKDIEFSFNDYVEETNTSNRNKIVSVLGEKSANYPSDIGISHNRSPSRRLPEIPSNTNNSKSGKNKRNISKQTLSSNVAASSGFNQLSDISAPQISNGDEIKEKFITQSATAPNKHPSNVPRENSLSNRSTRSKSIDSSSSEKYRLTPKVPLQHTQNAKSIDLSNLSRRRSFLAVDSGLLSQRSIDYPCIVRKQQDLSDIVRRRMLYSKISKQDTFSSSVEREHIPKTPRKIIIRQDNSIEIALSKPPKLRRHTLSEDYYCGTEPEFSTMIKDTTNSTLLPIPTPSATGGDRRKTIETCENIFLQAEESSKLRARTPPSNPHRILLHRDKNDPSKRTNGLGMRIVGGQECEDSSLGCFVTMISYGGPASVQGNIEVGDQILEFNGHSLIDSTYEEVRTLQDHCGDIVQLVVQHNNVRLQINGQNMTSLEISRHFETVPRLGPSSTRKRRNLLPLPSSLSSTFPKQSKKQLFETVETLEVPNVKELKPILINRGRLLAQIWHDVEDLKLALTVIQAGNLPLRPNGDSPYAYISGKMLFDDRGFDMFETKAIHSCNPVWNETFVFHEVEKVDVLRLEIFLWDKKKQNYHTHEENEEFIGMAQLPLIEANLEDEPRWYELRDRQMRKPSTTSVTFEPSSNEIQDNLIKLPAHQSIGQDDDENESLARGSNNGKSKKALKQNVINESNDRQSSSGSQIISSRQKNKMNTNLPENSKKNSLTLGLTPHLFPEYNVTRNTLQRASIGEIPSANDKSKAITNSTKLKRGISQGLTRLFVLRRFSDTGLGKSNMVIDSEDDDLNLKALPCNTTNSSSNLPVNFRPNRRPSECGTQIQPMSPTLISSSPRNSLIPADVLMVTTNPSARSSICQQLLPQAVVPSPLLSPFGPLQMQLLPPYMMSSRHSSISGSRKSSAASYCDSEDDIDRYFNQTMSENIVEDGNNIHSHQLGVAQVGPRNYENIINDDMHVGQIQLGLIVTKGLLEIDVIMARGLKRVVDGSNNNVNNESEPPDTYVKTYLRTGTRRVQKRKTAVIKSNFNPQYNTKLNYNASNVMGRRMQVMVWQRAKKFEKNQCIGEAFILLDNLNLTQHTIAWYKLFREHTVESDFYDSS